jgi:hypothetical protein
LSAKEVLKFASKLDQAVRAGSQRS